ncbi:hypothetical protein K4L06_09275 [Lysobacter sp. BMK333-48F3]|uniref:hypothetical protein n=1 Tax=Lysobacter sp. BMK333-48F3 TaxID=2867962 RepID=UPI001C8C230F|nr:hypothetical protein [Lysobacter sp. BMK333-48F3]MBX9401503.1 hypothetical protein [Lysobacter sp. BMK333-48F3]
MLAFRNTTGRTLSFSEGHLPWNNRYALRVNALLAKDGKVTRLQAHAPVSDHMRDVSVQPGEVASDGILFGDLVRDFEKFNREGDIIVHFSIESRSTVQPRFYGAPGVVLIPQRSRFSASCPMIVTKPR